MTAMHTFFPLSGNIFIFICLLRIIPHQFTGGIRHHFRCIAPAITTGTCYFVDNLMFDRTLSAGFGTYNLARSGTGVTAVDIFASLYSDIGILAGELFREIHQRPTIYLRLMNGSLSGKRPSAKTFMHIFQYTVVILCLQQSAIQRRVPHLQYLDVITNILAVVAFYRSSPVVEYLTETFLFLADLLQVIALLI